MAVDQNNDSRCELLCYAQNKLSNATKNGSVTTISGFYTMEEFVEAKVKLFEAVDKLRAGRCIDDKNIVQYREK